MLRQAEAQQNSEKELRVCTSRGKFNVVIIVILIQKKDTGPGNDEQKIENKLYSTEHKSYCN